MSLKRPRNNTLGRKGVTFGPGTVRNFDYDSLAKNGVISVLPATGLVAKEKPGNNWNAILARGIAKRPNGNKQTKPSVPHLAPNNARRHIAPVYSENSNAVMAEPVPTLGPAVVGASPASLWTSLSGPKGGRRSTRKRLTRKRNTRKRS